MTVAIAALASLQAELLDLKDRYGKNMHLKKAPPGSTTEAPFPVVAALSVDAPDSAHMYDVSSVKVTLTLESQAASSSASTELRADGVQVEVSSAELPRRLSEHMAGALYQRWRASFLGGQTSGRLALSSVFDDMQRNWVRLITALPELLEAYAAVDAAGASSRRYAIINDEASVQIDASGGTAALTSHASRTTSNHKTGTAQSAHDDQPRPVADLPGGVDQLGGRVQPSTAAGGGQADAWLEGLPQALRTEVTFLQRRYGAALSLSLVDQRLQSNGQASASGSATGASAASHQPQPPTSASQPLLAGDQALRFALAMEPTDPAWDRGTLPLVGIASFSYPAARSLTLKTADTGTTLSASTRLIIDKLLAAEAATLAGRPGMLRQLVKYADNRAGQLAQQADDVALEAARRRAQQAKQAAGAANGKQPTRESGTHRDTHLGDANQELGTAANLKARNLQPHAGCRLDQASEGACSSQVTADIASDFGRLHLADVAGHAQHSRGGTSESHPSSSGSHSSEGDSSGWSSSGSDHDSDDNAGPDTGVRGGGAAASGQQGESLGREALMLKLEGLRLDNVDALEALRVTIQVACARCTKGSGEVSLATEAVAGSAAKAGPGIQAAAECSNCHQQWLLSAVLRMVHDQNNVLATVKAMGCLPVDLLPSLLGGQCSSCTSAAAFRGVHVGVPCQRTCSHCHVSMSVHITAAAFVPKATPSPAEIAARKARTAARSSARHESGPNALLHVGEPLPSLGTCKHYHHSHRWLRFPCCGRRFPCDLCHEEQTDGHEMKWATRMVCGYCSVEQSLGDWCAKCGKRLAHSGGMSASGRRTRFWEGGQGQRNPSAMNRNDPHKYRGSKFKTRSQKSKRVGQEGAARNRRQEQ